jgi:hypothetical protein
MVKQSKISFEPNDGNGFFYMQTLWIRDITHYRLLILFMDMVRCKVHLKREISGFRFLLCFWLTPLCTRARQRLKLDLFNSFRMIAMTCDSEIPNCISIASNGVRSSHAISMILSMSFASIKNEGNSVDKRMFSRVC